MQSQPSSELVKAAIALLDLGLITLAFYTAFWVRFGSVNELDSFIWLYYFSAPLIILLLLRQGVLAGFRHQRLRDIFGSTILAFVIAGTLSSTVLYLSKTADYSRLLFGNYFALAIVFVLLEKIAVKKLIDSQLRLGRMNIRIAMVGFGPRFEDILGELKSRPQWGIAPVTVIDPQTTDVQSIVKNIWESIVDEVYIAYPRGAFYHNQIDDLLNRLEKLGLPVRLALNFDEFQDYYGQHACAVGSKAGILLSPYNLDPDQLILKRSMDVFGGIIGVLLTLLLTPFLAIAIKLESSGPLFFSHTRIGKGGREFTIYKFRSMYADAECKKDSLKHQNIHSGPLFKIQDDPRITRVGRVIRKYSLDEFPQFWNVLKGNMSLVGTRPPTPEEVELYKDHHFRRISIRPGLTGQWQIKGRNKIMDFDKVVAYDIDYIKNWNIFLDIKIIAQTVLLVFFPGRNGGI